VSGPAAATLVFTAYNSAHVIGDALRAVPDDCPVIVVDNASQDDGAAVAAAARPDARIIRAPRNLGFAGGCNLGLRAADTPFVAVVNPDLTLAPDAVARVLEAAARHPGVALFGLGGDRPAEGGLVDNPSPSGSFILMRRAVGAALGFFDEAFFLYFEDADLCLRARLAGHGVADVAGAAGRHAGAASTEPSFDNALEKQRLWGMACRHFADKHAACPEGRRAARKLAHYRARAALHWATGRWSQARVLQARLAGAAAVRRHGPAAMRDNAFARG